MNLPPDGWYVGCGDGCVGFSIGPVASLRMAVMLRDAHTKVMHPQNVQAQPKAA